MGLGGAEVGLGALKWVWRGQKLVWGPQNGSGDPKMSQGGAEVGLGAPNNGYGGG